MEIFCVSSFSPPPPTRQTFYTSLGPNIHAFRRIVELHLVLCFYYLTARQLLLQPSSVTPSPSPFGVALSYVSGGYLQDVSIYNELRVISVHPLKKKEAISPNVSEVSLGRETLETVNRAIEGIFLKHIKWGSIQSQTISK